MAEKAHINPEVLQWARKTAKMTVEAAAAKVNVKVERYISWELGENYPTIRQAQKLAHDFKRPFALFFFPRVPRDFQPLNDFRKAGSTELRTGSVFIIREIQQKQAWISELNQESGEKPLSFVGKFSLQENPEEVAADILKTLSVDPSFYPSGNNVIKEWIMAAEAQGIFVSRTSFIHSRLKLDSQELQGFAIADAYAPFVFVNSDDWAAPQLFTLVHELAHLWIAETGISNDIEPDKLDRNKFHPVELFCNQVAAAALMPRLVVKEVVEAGLDFTYQQVISASKKLGVSSLALLVRFYHLGLLSLSQYTSLKKQAEFGFQEFLKKEDERKTKQKERKGGPDPYLLKQNKNSRLFTQTVLDAFRGGIIEPTHASNLLNVQVNRFPKLESLIY